MDRLSTLPAPVDWTGQIDKLRSFQKDLAIWGNQNFRSFPWRLNNDPYAILMAELMLHRTQVAQVVPVFQRFIGQYPTISALITAEMEGVRTILSPLGLSWRIELIVEMVKRIEGEFASQIPGEKKDLLSLPGVSEYIAGAVRCFAWNFPEPLIDTNTTRIAGRLFGLQTKDSSRRNSMFRGLISSILDVQEPRRHNYALLDLAHLVCLKKNAPLCDQCPVVKYCHFGQNNIIESDVSMTEE
jgi:A/G-specific adenine glycosylase